MSFLRPALLLLLLPALFVWWKYRSGSGLVNALRCGAILIVVGALAQPFAILGDPGRDLIVLLDRSQSMPTGAEARALEWIRLAQSEADSGDRIGVIGFGEDATIERLALEGGQPFRNFNSELSSDGTDIDGAIRSALTLIPPGRNGALLLISDGENNATDPLDAAHRAASRGIQIHVLPQAKKPGADLSIERIDLSTEVTIGEPFQFSVWVRADGPTQAAVTLRRGQQVLSSGQRTFEVGLNRVLMRDILTDPGIVSYDVTLDHGVDARPENDEAHAALRVRGEERTLVLNHLGEESPLVALLRAAGLPVEVARPEDVLLNSLSLARWRAIILENISAGRIGPSGLQALREHVLERGAGLLLTGGKASFGVGGYHLSAIDELLPISMEQRQEHRKLGIAIAFVLDTSGSMGVVADPASGTTKMNLANAGTMAAIDLLSPLDSVAVLAVDSGPKLVIPLSEVGREGTLGRRVHGIQAGGGGIYVYTALAAAVETLQRAPQLNRHIVLFADAADAEEPEGVSELVQGLGELGTTISVIALGSESDPDADFLKSVARDGGGEAYFTNTAGELPKLFAQDTLTIARSTFVTEPTAIAVLPDVVSLGQVDIRGWPDTTGYNLNYLRQGAFAAAVTTDEYKSPLLSFWYQGVGRVAAFSGQIGGSHGQEFLAWDKSADLLVTLVRWLAGQEEPRGLFADVWREGHDLVVAVEVDPEVQPPVDTSNMVARIQDKAGLWQEHVLERTGPNRFLMRAPLRPDTATLGTIRVGGNAGAQPQVLRLPPMTLPYSPEFERSLDPERGPRLLRRLAKESGGIVDPSTSELWTGPRKAQAGRVFSRELLYCALLLVLSEIACRRLSLFRDLRLERIAKGLVRLRRATSLRAPKTSPDDPPSVPTSVSKPARSGRPEPHPAGIETATGKLNDETDTEIGEEQPGKVRVSQPEALSEALGLAQKRADRKTRR